jgi:hypothetical protein
MIDTQTKTTEELVRELPSELREEVRDFIVFLIQKKSKKARGQPSFEWEGALKEMREEYTSVELQHKISEQRAENL